MKKIKPKKQKNYGLIISYPEKSDYVLGGISPIPKEVLQTDKDWSAYLPGIENQNKGFETFTCVSFTILNCVEILLQRKLEKGEFTKEDIRRYLEKGFLKKRL